MSGALTKNKQRDGHKLFRPFLRVANVYSNALRLEEVHNIGVTESELDRVELRRFDLLVVEGNGSLDQIGRVALWDGSIQGCVHQNHLIKVRFGTELLAWYALIWCLSPLGRSLIEQFASSIAGLYTLGISKVENLPITVPVEHPEHGQRLLDVAKNAGYDLRYMYPTTREPQDVGLDAYLPLPGHRSQECASLASIDPSRIVNSAPVITIDSVVTVASIPGAPAACLLGRVASLLSTNGRLQVSIKYPNAQHLYIRPYEGFSKQEVGDEAVMDLQHLDPKKLSLLVPVYLHPQRCDVLRINALVAYIARMGVRVQPEEGSVYDAKKMQVPDTVAITPRTADWVAKAILSAE